MSGTVFLRRRRRRKQGGKIGTDRQRDSWNGRQTCRQRGTGKR
jgi:hypothetical protein